MIHVAARVWPIPTTATARQPHPTAATTELTRAFASVPPRRVGGWNLGLAGGGQGWWS